MTLISADIYQGCIDHYLAVRERPFVVKDAIPIPYFGDLQAYLNSSTRIVTAALNPSNIEFPLQPEPPRFDVQNGLSGPDGLEHELGCYFKRKPYRAWFGHFEHVLRGMEASYGMRPPLAPYTQDPPVHDFALHLDLCSPIATSPTWSHLKPKERGILTAFGRQTFEKLLDALKPDLVLASVAWPHLQGWSAEFANGPNWDSVLTYTVNQYGEPLRVPHLHVRNRTLKSPSGLDYQFANGSPSVVPFGHFTTGRKLEAGQTLRRGIEAMKC